VTCGTASLDLASFRLMSPGKTAAGAAHPPDARAGRWVVGGRRPIRRKAGGGDPQSISPGHRRGGLTAEATPAAGGAPAASRRAV
ncbi:MAG TPA: hypothetical protein VE466_14265, partial [Acidimicrobiales bacterium]|nr:hypothetical protein [Acidimicrobiales bacterium]